jgi:hypothetical protein
MEDEVCLRTSPAQMETLIMKTLLLLPSSTPPDPSQDPSQELSLPIPNLHPTTQSRLCSILEDEKKKKSPKKKKPLQLLRGALLGLIASQRLESVL